MEKRKKDGKRKEPASESAQPDGKKAYLTRPSKKKVVVPSDKARKKDDEKNEDAVQWKSASEQADWLTNAFFTVCGNKLSSLEREPIPGTAPSINHS